MYRSACEQQGGVALQRYSSLSKMSPCSEAGKPCNPCLDAAKACNLNETCKRLRSAYNSICSKATPPQPSLANQEPCSRKRCQKALRQFFERVSWELSYPLLFCSCPDQACAERRRRTIVPSCSHQERHKPTCLDLRRLCRSDALCRSRLADFHMNCQVTSHTVTSCPHDNYHGCLMSYVGLIGSDVTPNYSDSSPSNITMSLWCTCRGTGSQERECDAFHRDFTHNSCLSTVPDLQRPVSQDSTTTSRAFSISGQISSTPGALPPRSFLTTSAISSKTIDDKCPESSDSQGTPSPRVQEFLKVFLRPLNNVPSVGPQLSSPAEHSLRQALLSLPETSHGQFTSQKSTFAVAVLFCTICAGGGRENMQGGSSFGRPANMWSIDDLCIRNSGQQLVASLGLDPVLKGNEGGRRRGTLRPALLARGSIDSQDSAGPKSSSRQSAPLLHHVSVTVCVSILPTFLLLIS
ncbi:GDNF family receptor alpha-2-like [Plectropomus leopardus]|uniref:GDNF family receptor alpha-2-like n=1 Tax=Plectropomus leopardus TaxID=160734 RepID=UPI001C4C6DFA|nr:GDNF family receptor alpha-2-like [Plectropomus leopardus]